MAKLTKRFRYSLIILLIISPLVIYLFYPLNSSEFDIKINQAMLQTKQLHLAKLKPDTNRKPNIILIVADDLGKTDISLYGSKFLQTPHIDSIGYQGVTFTQGYVTAPICSPSRAGLLTGRYQQRFGHELQPAERYPRSRFEFLLMRSILGIGNDMQSTTHLAFPSNPEAQKQGLPLSEITLAELLKAKGYQTGMIGKWHLGHANGLQPHQRGFDYHYGFYASHSLYAEESDNQVINQHNPEFLDRMMWQSGREGTHAIYRNGQIQAEKSYLTEKFAQEATQFIEKNKNQPFFLYVPFNAPHTPLQAPKAYYDQFSHIQDPVKRIYYAMIKVLDDAVGKITQKLKASGLEENTIIYFISDNGGATYTHTTDNAPLKGGKFSNFEGGINVPFMMKWKGKIPSGLTYDKPVISLDFFATSAVIAQAPLPSDRVYDGVNLLPFVLNEPQKSPHKSLFWRSGYNKAIRQGNWKLIIDEKNKITRLYDLNEDISEKKDLSAQKPELVKSLQKEYLEWEAQLAKPAWPYIMSYVFDLEDGRYYYAL